MISLKRAYEPADKDDGDRILVDQLWPRGVKKEALKVEGWIKTVAPSTKLRSWFGHDPERWSEFRRRYFAELNKKPETWKVLLHVAQKGDLTLIYSAKDTEHNNAVALKEYLEKKMRSKTRKPRAEMAVA